MNTHRVAGAAAGRPSSLVHIEAVPDGRRLLRVALPILLSGPRCRGDRRKARTQRAQLRGGSCSIKHTVEIAALLANSQLPPQRAQSARGCLTPLNTLLHLLLIPLHMGQFSCRTLTLVGMRRTCGAAPRGGRPHARPAHAPGAHGSQAAGVLGRRGGRPQRLPLREPRGSNVTLPVRRRGGTALLGVARGGRGQAAGVTGRARRARLGRDSLKARHAPAVPPPQLGRRRCPRCRASCTPWTRQVVTRSAAYDSGSHNSRTTTP